MNEPATLCRACGEHKDVDSEGNIPPHWSNKGKCSPKNNKPLYKDIGSGFGAKTAHNSRVADRMELLADEG